MWRASRFTGSMPSMNLGPFFLFFGFGEAHAGGVLVREVFELGEAFGINVVEVERIDVDMGDGLVFFGGFGAGDSLLLALFPADFVFLGFGKAAGLVEVDGIAIHAVFDAFGILDGVLEFGVGGDPGVEAFFQFGDGEGGPFLILAGFDFVVGERVG